MRRNIYCVALFMSCCIYAGAQAQSLKLWYRQPAGQWLEALPVGNGRMGAMVYARPDSEQLQINEESVWAGSKFDDNNPNSLRVLDSVRQLLFAGKNQEATDLAQQNMVAVVDSGSSKRAASFRSYQTLMNLHLVRDAKTPVTDYERELQLNTGIARSHFTQDGIRYTEEVFASAPDDMLVLHLEADQPGKIRTVLYLDRPDDQRSTQLKDAETHTLSDNLLLLSGQIIDPADDHGPSGAHMKFAGLVYVKNEGGKLLQEKDRIRIENASSLSLYITAATNYNLDRLDIDTSVDPVQKCLEQLKEKEDKSYTVVRAAQVLDHATLMDRVSLRLSDEQADTMPTDVRLERVKAGQEDKHLTELYFQYGRYLLLGSSRNPGSLPANLQGIWNNQINAPWQADFHTNINLQMNYWPAEVTNLSETTLPLFAFISRLQTPGEATAKEMYGCRGWTMHHCTDVFGKTSLQNAVWYGTFPMATAWVCLHFWEHFSFTQDTTFLRDTAYALMKGHALFIKDFLVRSPEGYLVTAPAYSPENSYIDPTTGKPVSLTYGPTMDNQIIREFLTHFIQAANILDKDPDLVDSLQDIISQLPPTRLGDDGRILEWIKPYKEAEPGHRHMSHLFGLYPGTQISAETPDLYAGARKSLEYRLSHGGGHTGWSRAWIINFYARLHDGEQAHEHLQKLFERSTLSNLFDNHPPFQIDGNFGGTAGIAEMLLQSQNGVVELLPALPPAWAQGEVKGLVARGDFVVSFNWQQHRVQQVSVTARKGGTCLMKVNGKVHTLYLQPGEKKSWKEL